MKVFEYVDLCAYTTFGVHAKARWFVEYASLDELRCALADVRFADLRRFHLGGGSNTLFVGDFDGVVFHPVTNTLTLLREDEECRYVEVDAGFPWREFVRHCVNENWPGPENLAHIPGTVGGAVVQNVGAYGVEVAELVDSVRCLNLETDTVETLTVDQCDYGYRTSVFKSENNRRVVLSVIFSLPKVFTPKISYKGIANAFIDNPPNSPKDIYDVVVETRRRKLPEPGVIGSAGSFFKNPVVPKIKLQRLLEEAPQLVSYPLAGGRGKLAAGWMIDAVGFKGKRFGDAAVYEKNALVLVNYGFATGEDILKLSKMVSDAVYYRFGVQLEPEPVIVE